MNDKTEYLRGLDRNALKLNAKRLLSDQSIRMKLVFATLICASAFIMLEYILSYAFITPLYSLFPKLTDWASFGIDEIYYIIEFLMFSPLLIGFYSLAAGLSLGADVELSHIFGYYRSFMRMCRSWMISLAIVLPIKLFTTGSELVFMLLDANQVALGEMRYSLLSFMAELLFIGISVLAFLLCGRFYPFVNAAVVSDDQKLSAAFGASLRSTRGQLGRIFAFRLSFLLLIMLSLATVGVLFIIFTIPYMAVSYSYCSSYLLTGEYNIINLEDSYNEQ